LGQRANFTGGHLPFVTVMQLPHAPQSNKTKLIDMTTTSYMNVSMKPPEMAHFCAPWVLHHHVLHCNRGANLGLLAAAATTNCTNGFFFFFSTCGWGPKWAGFQQALQCHSAMLADAAYPGHWTWHPQSIVCAQLC